MAWSAFPLVKIGASPGTPMRHANSGGPPACVEACRNAGDAYIGANFITVASNDGDVGCFCIPESAATDNGGLGENWCFFPCHDDNCTGTAFVASLDNMPASSCSRGEYLHCPNATVDNEYLHLLDPSKFEDEGGIDTREECEQFCTAQGSAGFVWDENENPTKCVGCIIPSWIGVGDPARQICVQDAPSRCSARETYVRKTELEKHPDLSFNCDVKCQPKPANGSCRCDCAYEGPGAPESEWKCTNKRDTGGCANGSSAECVAPQTETALAADRSVKGCWYKPDGHPDGKNNHGYSDSHCMCTCKSGNSQTDSCGWVATTETRSKFGCLTKSFYPEGTCETHGTLA